MDGLLRGDEVNRSQLSDFSFQLSALTLPPLAPDPSPLIPPQGSTPRVRAAASDGKALEQDRTAAAGSGTPHPPRRAFSAPAASNMPAACAVTAHPVASVGNGGASARRVLAQRRGGAEKDEFQTSVLSPPPWQSSRPSASIRVHLRLNLRSHDQQRAILISTADRRRFTQMKTELRSRAACHSPLITPHPPTHG